MTDPTVAETVLAKMIAVHHGSTSLFRKPEGGMATVANLRGSGTGWSWEVDNYVEKHWREYVGAARAIIGMNDL